MNAVNLIVIFKALQFVFFVFADAKTGLNLDSVIIDNRIQMNDFLLLKITVLLISVQRTDTTTTQCRLNKKDYFGLEGQGNTSQGWLTTGHR